MRQLIRVHPDERVDLPDFEQVGGLLELFDIMRSNKTVILPDGRDVGAAPVAPTDTRVFSGFDLYDIVGASGTCKLRRGAGIFKLLEDGALTHGILIGDVGATFASLDLSSESDDTYSVFVRATYTDTDQENRVHWNVGGSPAEYIDFVNTRRSLIWEYQYQSSSAAHPSGGDWVEVARITIVSNQITATADYRMLYFEGDAISGGGQWSTEWGSANDRNADRSTYGVTDFHNWVQAMRAKWIDVQGDGYAWQQQPDVNLTDMEDEHWGYAKDAGASRGRHKDMYIGDTNRWWRLYTAHSAGVYDQVSFLSDDSPIDGQMSIYTFDAGGITVNQAPRGDGVAMSDGDTFGWQFGSSVEFKWTGQRVSSTKYKMDMKRNVTTDITLQVGSGYTDLERGIVIGANAGYHLTSRQVVMFVPLETMMNAVSGANRWRIDGPAGGDVAAEAPYLYCDGAGEELFLTIHDFPEWCTLDYVDVWWHQSANASGGNDTRLYVGRAIYTGVPGTEYVSTQVGTLSLNTSNNFIEYFKTANPYEVLRFTCNQNNTNFRRTTDMISLGLVSPSTDATVASSVFGVRLTFTYTRATPFPL